MVTSIPPFAGKSKVATTTTKMCILFHKSTDITVGYFGKNEFVDCQRAHHDTFGNNPMIFPDNPTKQEKTMTEKELYTFYEICMFDVFIHIIRNIYVGTDNVDDSRSTHEMRQEINFFR